MTPLAEPPKSAERKISSPSQIIELPPRSIVGSGITVKTITSDESHPVDAVPGKVCTYVSATVYGIKFQIKGLPSQVEAVMIFCTAGQSQEITSTSVVKVGI